MTDSDEQLLGRWKNGDQAALTELALRYLPQFYRTARAMSFSHAQSEDVAQEVMVKVIRALDSFRSQDGFRVWSYTILLNTIRTEFQRNRRTRPAGSESFLALEAGAAEPITEFIQREQHAAFETALCNLTELQRTALVLMHIDGLSAGEIASIQACSVDAVYQRISDAKRKLRNDQHLRKVWLEPDEPS
ncbi:MAG: RNA polymerase sigma factor [Planctomycetota bacterium]|jgi:RNA polymerase sigma factor (sigma-70 family)